MTDSGSGVLGSTAADADTTPKPGPSLPLLEARLEEPTGRSAGFDACVEDIRKLYGSNICFLFPRLEDLIRRRLRVAPLSAGAFALGWLSGSGIRLLFALVASVVAGQWAGIPWGRWLPILVFLGLADASRGWEHPSLDIPPKPHARRMVEESTALLPAIARASLSLIHI